MAYKVTVNRDGEYKNNWMAILTNDDIEIASVPYSGWSAEEWLGACTAIGNLAIADSINRFTDIIKTISMLRP